MRAGKWWVSSGGFLLLLGVLWLCVGLLGFTNGNSSSSVWMLPVAATFFFAGLAQTLRAKRRPKL